MQIKQKGQTGESNTYSLFVYAVRSQVTRDYYLRRLRIFFNYIGLLPEGIMEDRCNIFAKNEIAIPKRPEVLTSLSNVIQIINKKFMGDITITDAYYITVEGWLKDLEHDSDLREVARKNLKEDFDRRFETKLRNQMIKSLSDHNKYLISKIFEDSKIQKKILSAAADIYYKWARSDLPSITPGTPAENRSNFRTTIQKCKGFLYWVDHYIGKEGLEFLMDSFDHQNINEIKILTSLYNNFQINEELRNWFEAFQKEMRQKGISLEMRLLSTKDAHDRTAHDGYLIGENIAFNVPSFTTITKGRFSEIKTTTNDIPFMVYWNDKESLDISKDWIKIKNILDKAPKVRYDAICSNCKKEIQVPFKPDPTRPVYCNDCRLKL